MTDRPTDRARRVPTRAVVTTIVARLDLELAKRVARAADVVGLTHEQLAVQAIRLFVRSVSPTTRKPRKPRKER